MSQALDSIQTLVKALEAGNYDQAPSTLTQGSALQIEDLSPVMNNVTFENSHIKLQKIIGSTPCKSTLAQFTRQLSYGIFGGSAQLEGNVGQEETSDIVRITVPMAFYSHTRRVTIASTMVATVDGKKSDERAASDAAIKLLGDIEFDCFRGLEDFSNSGVFDGNPLVIPALPNIHGLGLQVRQSDFQVNARDAMFAEYGNDDSVVLSGGGTTLSQDKVEDASVRSALNFGTANRLLVDPIVLSAYNKITFGKERIILAGSPQDATGGDLRKQWVSGGTVNVEGSQFLRGKAKPARPRPNGPSAPSISGVAAAGGTLGAGDYIYYTSSQNEVGESQKSASITVTATANQKVTLTVTHPGSGTTPRCFNVYRSGAGAPESSAKFIGRVVMTPNSATTLFVDLGNKTPGFVTGFLIQGDTMEMMELSPYSRLKMAVTDLSTPEAHFRFCTLAVVQPRKNVLIDSLRGTL
jgi:hypothetical protein